MQISYTSVYIFVTLNGRWLQPNSPISQWISMCRNPWKWFVGKQGWSPQKYLSSLSFDLHHYKSEQRTWVRIKHKSRLRSIFKCPIPSRFWVNIRQLYNMLSMSCWSLGGRLPMATLKSAKVPACWKRPWTVCRNSPKATVSMSVCWEKKESNMQICS